MEYKAIMTFIDSADSGKTYREGDVFEGTKKRIKELSTDDNKVGFPVIEAIPEKKKTKPKKTEAKGSK